MLTTRSLTSPVVVKEGAHLSHFYEVNAWKHLLLVKSCVFAFAWECKCALTRWKHIAPGCDHIYEVDGQASFTYYILYFAVYHNLNIKVRRKLPLLCSFLFIHSGWRVSDATWTDTKLLSRRKMTKYFNLWKLSLEINCFCNDMFFFSLLML